MLKDPTYTAPPPREQAEAAKQLTRTARAAYMRQETPERIKTSNEARAKGWKGVNDR